MELRGPALIKLLMLSGLMFATCWQPSLHAEPRQSGHEVTTSPLSDTFGIQAGAYFSKATTGVRVDDNELDIGTRVHFEKFLDLDSDKAIPSLIAYWRLSRRWRFDFEYMRLHRNGRANLDVDIDWGDLSFPAGVEVASKLNQDIFRFSFGYAFYRTENVEIGGSLGLFWTQLKAGVSGNAYLGNNSLEFRTATHSLPVPLPVIGMYGSYVLSPRWLLKGRVDYFNLDLSISDLRVGGRAVNAEASVEYAMTKNIWIGGGYRYVDVAVGAEDGDFRGILAYTLSGPFVFTRVSY